jgi:hypothetical protein
MSLCATRKDCFEWFYGYFMRYAQMWFTYLLPGLQNLMRYAQENIFGMLQVVIDIILTP